jgi:hypothetical protein
LIGRTGLPRAVAARDGTLRIGAKDLASWKNGKLTQYPELAGQFIFSLIVQPALISLLLPLEAVATAFIASGMSRLSSEGCIFARVRS